MSGELAGAAEILTGAAIARAVEPEAGEGQVASGNCQNCGAALVGAHCHECGQKAKVHRTLRAFGHDILHSVLHFDGKIWRTLPMLFWNPGELTRRYVHGERAKFVSPLALFLFTVFLTFAVFNWLVPSSAKTETLVSPQEAQRQYQADRKEILDDIAKLEADKKDAIAEGTPDYQWMDSEIARHQDSLQQLDQVKGAELRRSDLVLRQFERQRSQGESDIRRLEAQLALAKSSGAPTDKVEEDLQSAQIALDLTKTAAGALQKGEGNTEFRSRFTDLDFPGAESLNAAVKTASENPQLLFYKMQSNAYKFSWALIPISVPFVWLLFFWRRRFKMFDHAVFVTYSITFMMLLGVICALFISVPGLDIIAGLAIAFYPAIHMYRHLHRAYQTSRFGAFWRMILLSTFAIIALTLFATLIIALGVTG
jgi:hypothetical protein